jgi:hypothetical protein
MADKEDLKFYLTNLEPMMSQNSLSQSIGGYYSTTEINPARILSNSIDRTQTTINVQNLDNDYILQNTDELMKVVSITNSNIAEITRGTLNTDAKFGLANDLFYSIKKNNLFNNSFNSDGKQYRCIAVKNCGLDIFYNLKFYFKKLSNNSQSNVKMAVEIPKTEILTGTATGGNTISLADITLKNLFNEEYNDSVLYITTGDNINLGRKIATFDRPTGTFTFTNSFPYPVKSGIQYRIDNSPSQRIISGKNNPTTGTIYCTDFSAPNNLTNAISIDFSNTRLNNEHLLPNEVVYLWFERTVLESLENENNRVILTSSYKNVI